MKMKVFDETVPVRAIREGEETIIPFCDLEEGDIALLPTGYRFEVGITAHHSEDPDYEGWILYDSSNTGYFPEDFGGRLLAV